LGWVGVGVLEDRCWEVGVGGREVSDWSN